MPVLGAGYIGDYAEDYTTLNLKFSTFTTGWVPVALAGTPIITIYTGSATGTEVTTGVTHVEDFDGITGLNNVLIDLSSAAFYAVAADYHVVITQGTIDSVDAAGTVVGSFSIENRKSKADVIEWLGTAVTAATAGLPNVNMLRIENNNSAALALSRWLRNGGNGFADEGTTTTLTDSALSQADDWWNGSMVVFFNGTLAGQARLITDFDAATDTITFTPPTTTGVTTEGYHIIPGTAVDVQSWLGTVSALQAPNALVSGAVNADVSNMQSGAVDDIWAKTMTELGSVPGVTGTTLAALEWLFLLARNKGTQTSTTKTLRNDADDGDVGASAISSDGTTFTRGEWS